MTTAGSEPAAREPSVVPQSQPGSAYNGAMPGPRARPTPSEDGRIGTPRKANH
jgi:hypothetical protein